MAASPQPPGPNGLGNIPPWRQYIHLYLPAIASIVLVFHGTSIARTLGFTRFPGGDPSIPLVLFSALFTHILGSQFYPPNQRITSPEQQIRFTRKNTFYRALVLVTYGRLYGTQFNLVFFLADLLCSFAADRLVGERPIGTPQRRSEFVVALAWVAGSYLLGLAIPLSVPIVGLLVVALDRTLWRTAYIALVDDIIGVLTKPNVRSLKGRATLFVVQAGTINLLSFLGSSWIRRRATAGAGEPSL